MLRLRAWVWGKFKCMIVQADPAAYAMYIMRLESCLDWHQAWCSETHGGWRLPLLHAMQMS
jgi:hypothetical protein